MATHVRSNLSIDLAVEIADAIAAALSTDPETEGLAPPWAALVTRGDALAGRIREQRRVAKRARARVTVADAAWDKVLRAFERAVIDLAGGSRDMPVYKTYFRTATGAEITRFGIDREVEFGRATVTLLTTHIAPLSPWADKIGPATDTLESASRARIDAVHAMGPLLTAQYLYVEDLNTELDRLEGGLLTTFPGDAKRVASYLSATRRDDPGVPDAAPVDLTPTPATGV